MSPRIVLPILGLVLLVWTVWIVAKLRPRPIGDVQNPSEIPSSPLDSKQASENRPRSIVSSDASKPIPRLHDREKHWGHDSETGFHEISQMEADRRYQGGLIRNRLLRLQRKVLAIETAHSTSVPKDQMGAYIKGLEQRLEAEIEKTADWFKQDYKPEQVREQVEDLKRFTKDPIVVSVYMEVLHAMEN